MRKSFFVFAICSLCHATLSHAEPATTAAFGSRSIGHNVSTTTQLLRKKELSIGTYYIGYGLAENWTVASSPFTLALYKSALTASRWAWDLGSSNRILVGLEYIKTFPQPWRNESWRDTCAEYPEIPECVEAKRAKGFDFKMEVWDAKITYSHQANSYYRPNLTLSYYHYVDDDLPFSLRMDPGNDDPYAFNVTSLHEIRLHSQYFLILEAGIWGMNYQYPYLHFGASLNYQPRPNILVCIGASTTYSPGFPADKARVYVGYDSRYSVHPEIQLQAFL